MTDPRGAETAAGIFEDEDAEVADQHDFARALTHGTDALQRGDAALARNGLEKALRYKPRNQRARNLLGLALFKLGELERAESIYRGLIEDHPSDPTLRVNLGLVFLKSNASGDAVRCFETALDLAPDHQKAQNYLGLALAQKGDLARAREWFRRSGNSAMADRMSQALAASPVREVAQEAARTLNEPNPFRSALEPEPSALNADPAGQRSHVQARNLPATAAAGAAAPTEATSGASGSATSGAEVSSGSASDGTLGSSANPSAAVASSAKPSAWTASSGHASAAGESSGDSGAGNASSSGPAVRFAPADPAQPPTRALDSRWVATDPGTPPAPPVAPREQPTLIGRLALHAPAPEAPPAATPAEAAAELSDSTALVSYTSSTMLSVPANDGGFGIGPAEVLIQLKGEMLTRLDGLVASWGSVVMKPELKRFRGKATDKPFGDGARRMLRATGEGRFIISREGRHFTALELGDEPAYFREEILFAFQESIVFENGRVPSKTGPDLHLVQLRGRGKLLLVTVGTPKAVEIVKGEPMRIPMDQLVGWHGPLIQPRLVPIVEEAPELGVALELAGEGRALLDGPDGR